MIPAVLLDFTVVPAIPRLATPRLRKFREREVDGEHRAIVRRGFIAKGTTQGYQRMQNAEV